MSTAVERPATHKRCGLPGNADYQLECALKRKLADGVITGVGAIDHVVVADMQPVRLFEYIREIGESGMLSMVSFHHFLCAALSAIPLALKASYWGFICCIRPNMSALPQCSTYLPSRSLIMSITARLIALPVPGIPRNVPLCVPW